MAQVVVLGGSGFIGTHVVEKLTGEGWDVAAPPKQDLDLTLEESVHRAVSGWDRSVTVIFCAGITPTRDASWHAAGANIRMAKNLAQSLPPSGLRGLLFISSSCVYGNPVSGKPIGEDTPLHPADAYGFSKIESESLLAERSWKLNMPFLALRPSIVFGRHDGRKSLLGRWLNAVRQDLPVAVQGKGAAKLDLVTVDDVCEVVAHWVRRPFGGALNVASGQPLGVTRIVELVGEALGKKAAIDRTTRAGEPEYDRLLDTVRLNSLFPDRNPARIPDAIRAYAQFE